MSEVVRFTAAEAVGPIGRALLRLNNAHAVELSLLDEAGLAGLVAEAFWAGRVGTAAFVIAFGAGSTYAGGHFQWFRGRFERFAYVDRVAVAPSLRRQGVARALYAAVTAQARTAGFGRVVCEVNTHPANEESLRMHEGMGFRAVGTGALAGGKRVIYLERAI